MTFMAILLRSYRQQFALKGFVTVRQFAVLDLIDHSGGSLQPKEIAQQLSLSSGTVTPTIDKLEKLGLLARKYDQRNRRIVHVHCTTQAYPVIEDGRQIALGVVQQQLAPLGRFLTKVIDDSPSLFIRFNGLGSQHNMSHELDFYRACLYCSDALHLLLKREHLNLLEFRILFELMDHRTGISISTLSKRLLSLLPDVSTACNVLFGRRFIARSRDPVDRRTTLVDITSDGYSSVRRVAPDVDRLLLDLATYIDRESREWYIKAAALICNDHRHRFRPE
jgi:DNA-binding MarR family transcriptional regulator